MWLAAAELQICIVVNNFWGGASNNELSKCPHESSRMTQHTFACIQYACCSWMSSRKAVLASMIMQQTMYAVVESRPHDFEFAPV
jgi:hypothetical protein